MKISRELRQLIAKPGIVLAVCLMVSAHHLDAQIKATVVATIREKDLIPEGIAYDAGTKTIFLSSIFKSKIIAVSEKGVARDFIESGQDGIKQVLGMKVFEGNLWACNNSAEHDTVNREANIHVYNLATGKLVKKITVSDGTKHLFNDIFFTADGDAYITDSDGAGIFLVRTGGESAEPFISGGTIPYPNGITGTADGKKLIVSTGGGQGIVTIDLATKQISAIRHDKYLLIGSDGLYRYKNKLIAIQNVTFPEGIVEMTLNHDESTVENIRHLLVNVPQFDTPTTGVIVSDDLYFIANSQLTQLLGTGGSIKAPAKLKESVIMKIKLN